MKNIADEIRSCKVAEGYPIKGTNEYQVRYSAFILT
jgi:hypothetical protein